jgi:hypothetical protein
LIEATDQFDFVFRALTTLLSSRSAQDGATSKNEAHVAGIIARWKAELEGMINGTSPMMSPVTNTIASPPVGKNRFSTIDLTGNFNPSSHNIPKLSSFSQKGTSAALTSLPEGMTSPHVAIVSPLPKDKLTPASVVAGVQNLFVASQDIPETGHELKPSDFLGGADLDRRFTFPQIQSVIADASAMISFDHADLPFDEIKGLLGEDVDQTDDSVRLGTFLNVALPFANRIALRRAGTELVTTAGLQWRKFKGLEERIESLATFSNPTATSEKSIQFPNRSVLSDSEADTRM